MLPRAYIYIYTCIPDVAQGTEGLPDDELIRMIEVVLERVCHEHQNLGVLVQQQHEPQVPDAFLGELLARDQLQALHLSKVRGVPEHVDEEQLGYIPVSIGVIFVLECRADGSALFRDGFALLRQRLARPHRTDQLPAPSSRVNVQQGAPCAAASTRKQQLRSNNAATTQTDP